MTMPARKVPQQIRELVFITLFAFVSAIRSKQVCRLPNNRTSNYETSDVSPARQRSTPTGVRSYCTLLKTNREEWFAWQLAREFSLSCVGQSRDRHVPRVN